MEEMTREEMKEKIDRLEKIVKDHEKRIQALESAIGMGKPETIKKRLRDREPSTMDFPMVDSNKLDKDKK